MLWPRDRRSVSLPENCGSQRCQAMPHLRCIRTISPGREQQRAVCPSRNCAKRLSCACHTFEAHDYEENRLPIVRSLDALVPITDAIGIRRASAVYRPRRRRRRARTRTARIFACIISPASSARRFRCWQPSGAKTGRIEIGTAVIDMRYENPLYMAEDAGAADIIAGGRLQLGISRGSPNRSSMDGDTSATRRPRARRTPTWPGATPRSCSTCCAARASRKPNPRPMFPNPPGLLRIEPHSEGLRERIWWGASSNATAAWARKARYEPAELHAQG